MTISAGWGGIDKAAIEVYGIVPECGGLGRPPTRKKLGSDWIHMQMVIQRDEHDRFQGAKLRAIFRTQAEAIALWGDSTVYSERSNLTNRLFNDRQAHKTLAFSKVIHLYRGSVTWGDGYYNLIHPNKNLRTPDKNSLSQKWSLCTAAMAAKLTDHIWTVKKPLTNLS